MDPTANEEHKRVMKEAMKEALKEWLDDQWATFGKWTAHGLLAMVFAALTFFWFQTHGFKVTP